MVVASLSLELVSFVAAGVLLVRLGVVDRAFIKKLSGFIMDVPLPCLTVSVISQQPFGGDLAFIGVIIGMALVYLSLFFLLGQGFNLAMKKTEAGRLVRFSCMFTNFTLFGMPVMIGLFGSEGLFIYTMFCLPSRVLYYGFSDIFLNGVSEHKGEPPGKILKTYITPPIVAIFVGLFFYFTRLSLPGFFASAISAMGSVCSPLGMMICGATMADASLREIIKNRDALIMTLARGLAAPTCIIALIYFLPLDPLLKKVICMSGAMPMPSLITTFSLKYNVSEKGCRDASLALCASTMLAIVTLPFWAYLVELLIK